MHVQGQKEETVDQSPKQSAKELTPDDWDFYLIPIRNWFTRIFLQKRKPSAKNTIARMITEIADLQQHIREQDEKLHLQAQHHAAELIDVEQSYLKATQALQERLTEAEKWKPRVRVGYEDMSDQMAFTVKVSKMVWKYHDKKMIFQDVMTKIKHHFMYQQDF